MNKITWNDFMKVDIRVGTVLSARAFPEARKPAYVVEVDFGPEIGVLKCSAQVTDLYLPGELVGMQILGVVNFPEKQIGPIRSQFLLTGMHREDGSVVLAVPQRSISNGSRLL
jgi:tRNA-binding protein